MLTRLADSPALRQRFRPLWWLAITYLVVGAVTRIVLWHMSGDNVPLTVVNIGYTFGVGLVSDLVTLLYVAWPFLLYLWLAPTRFYASRLGQGVMYLLALATLYLLLFVAASELVFWDEFGVRFNFIAVDYLVYTTEVIGNIRESYPIGRWMTWLAVAVIIIVLLTRRGLRTRDTGTRFGRRSRVALVWLVLTVGSVYLVNGTQKDQLENTYVNELAGNGIYQFFAAFRSSHLDYDRFYRTMPIDKAFEQVRADLQTPDATYVSNDPHDLTRAIRHRDPEQRLNVVLISVESLSAEFIKAFGSTHGDITPNLDALAGQSLFFENLYANGTRTVRGLEALSLSIPPTPGDSLIKEPHDENLLTLADIFNNHGYQSDFVYGGYGTFDNMNYYFAHNGYRAVDRTDIPKGATIHSENVWGVADEDLYTLALAQMDQIHATGKPFFLHIMTTSNHRPYTFPAGRVKQPNGTRDGAIAYTDWSIADFIQRARSKPYFDDTLFVITADHDASSAGRTSIPINRYHIPLWIYAPKHFAPQRIERPMSQVDIAPTLLGLLNFNYRSRFFGYDIFALEPGRGRAFPATYEKLGYLRDKVLTILAPQRHVEQVQPDFASKDGDATLNVPMDQQQVDLATAYYQVAAYAFKHGLLAHTPADDTPVLPLAPAPASSTDVPAASTSSSTAH